VLKSQNTQESKEDPERVVHKPSNAVREEPIDSAFVSDRVRMQMSGVRVAQRSGVLPNRKNVTKTRPVAEAMIVPARLRFSAAVLFEPREVRRNMG